MKLEDEIVQEQQPETSNINIPNEEVMNTNDIHSESIVEDNSVNEMEKSFTQEAIEEHHKQPENNNIENETSNDLKEFGVESDAPDLFNSETENSSSEDLLPSDDEQEDDLAIPAFLRRQKN